MKAINSTILFTTEKDLYTEVYKIYQEFCKETGAALKIISPELTEVVGGISDGNIEVVLNNYTERNIFSCPISFDYAGAKFIKLDDRNKYLQPDNKVLNEIDKNISELRLVHAKIQTAASLLKEYFEEDTPNLGAIESILDNLKYGLPDLIENFENITKHLEN